MRSAKGLACTVLAALVVCVGVPAPASAASAADMPAVLVPDLPPPLEIDEAAREATGKAYARMMECHGKKDLAGAVEAGLRVYELAPNPSTAFIRAWILSEAKRHCEAFESLLRAADLELTEEERKQVMARLPASARQCGAGYGWAKLEIVPADATVTVGGASVPAGRTVGVRAGRHALAVEAPGYQRLEAFIRVKAGKGRDDSYELARAKVPAPAPVTAAPAPKPAGSEAAPVAAPVERAEAAPGADNTLSWVLIGSGGALVAAGAGFFVWALDARSEAGDLAAGKGGLGYEESKEAYSAARDDVTLRQTLAYGAAGLGAAAVVVGILTRSSGEVSVAAGLRVEPWVGSGRTGLRLTAPF